MKEAREEKQEKSLGRCVIDLAIAVLIKSQASIIGSSLHFTLPTTQFSYNLLPFYAVLFPLPFCSCLTPVLLYSHSSECHFPGRSSWTSLQLFLPAIDTFIATILFLCSTCHTCNCFAIIGYTLTFLNRWKVGTVLVVCAAISTVLGTYQYSVQFRGNFLSDRMDE